jgi:hypothetical protein
LTFDSLKQRDLRFTPYDLRITLCTMRSAIF